MPHRDRLPLLHLILLVDRWTAYPMSFCHLKNNTINTGNNLL